MSKIALGKSGNKTVWIDLDILMRTRALIEGNSGCGKSETLQYLAEQLDGKVQVIILDREGEFSILRKKHNYVLVGKGGDTPADCRSAAMVAHKLLELRASAVCDLYEMKDSERHRWVKLFLEALIDSPKHLWHPVIVIIDEVHTFCPEKGAGESEASDAVIGLATRGRKRGFCMIGATQRLGKFRKDAAAELLNIIVGMTFIDVDRKRASEALGIPRSEEKRFFDEIKVMEEGSFWVLGRAISRDRTLVKVNRIETPRPQAGSSKHSLEPPPPPEKVRALLPKLADLPKAAEERAKTEAELRSEIRSLRGQLQAAQRAIPAPKPLAEQKVVEVPAWRPQDLVRLERALEVADKSAGKVVGAAGHLRGFADHVRETVKRLEENRRGLARSVPSRPLQTPPVLQREAPSPTPSDENGNALDKSQRAILTVLVHNHAAGCELGKLALLSGYRVSGGFRNKLAALRSRGYIDGPNTGTMRVTDQGLDALGPLDPLPSGRGLAEFWLRHPSLSGAARKVLAVLLENPDGMAIDQLAQASGYEVSGGFRNTLSTLRTAGVLVGRNTEQMRAAPLLMDTQGG